MLRWVLSMRDDRPVGARTRWALRIACTIPLVVATLLVPPGARQAAAGDLLEHAHAVQWGSSDLGWATDVFPPIPAALLAAFGYHVLVLSLVACGAVALLLARLTGVLVRSGWSVVAVGAVVATVLLSPPVYVVVSERPDQALGIVLVAFAAEAMVGFVRRGSTRSGMESGLALGAAVFMTSGAWLYVLGVVAAAVIATARVRPRSAHVLGATVAVLVFPAAATSAFWVYIAWWFGGDARVALSQFGAIPDGVPSSAWANLTILAAAAIPGLVLVLASRLFKVSMNAGKSRVLAGTRAATGASAGRTAGADAVSRVPDPIPSPMGYPAGLVPSQRPGGSPVRLRGAAVTEP